ncbi:glycosyltransferase [Desulfovibrio gilichinskyi]|uniref:Glycosyltransferase involved in cell wall bisynthesis n=1 Tax=Desulfovibrio gilichinskyi TaxID=1519643 RepID=A0A1X7EI81_9BACT|nr:glycosyltransferase [Desulfovibrio gilichinskyi]SMF33932.1 Glycosyltransferase involved in cell wall bisynthesis [Desulfovibrio gilichinskyi]
MFFKKYDVGIIGNLCTVDLNIANSLAELGVKVLVFSKANSSSKGKTIDNYHNNSTAKYDIHNYRSSLDFYLQACSCKILLSFTGAVLGPMKKIYPLRFLPIFPPIINFATGSDITEFMGEKNLKSFLFRLHLRMSSMNCMVEYPHALKNILHYKIPKVYFMPFPAFRLPDKKLPFPDSKIKIIFFHPSHLDWQVSDSHKVRYSSKGNDRFIRAFIRAIKNGMNAQCVILDRGSDSSEAHSIIDQSGVKESFIWKKDLSRDELFQEFLNCHVVVDQFDVGGLGGIAAEAMASGRPVITYIEKNCSRLIYGGDTPPVMNCWSEDEIYNQILACADLDMISVKAEDSYTWVNRQHNCNIVCDKILFYISLITGQKFKDYGWNKNAYNK